MTAEIVDAGMAPFRYETASFSFWKHVELYRNGRNLGAFRAQNAPILVPIRAQFGTRMGAFRYHSGTEVRPLWYCRRDSGVRTCG
jgi:hypothetical protein